MPNTSRGYTYPDSTGHDRLWEHYEELATDINDDVDEIVSKPIGKATQSVNQALTDATFVAITLTTEEFDTHAYHSTSVNTSRITPNMAGYHRFTGTVVFEATATPVAVDVHFRKNGTDSIVPAIRAVGATTILAQQVTVTIPFNGSGDYVELMGRQDSAGADNTQVNLPFACCVEWEYLRPL
jgi:hypothetical protein